MKQADNMVKLVVFLSLMGSLFACGDNGADKFREAIGAGNLSEAQECLMKMDGEEICPCALQLIRAYMSVDAVDKAIHVYENITPWHRNRYDMKWSYGDYERTVCKLFREHLVKNGEYEAALNYYPLEYESEDYIGNAQSYYIYISDVVADMCAKGQQDGARKFVKYRLRWFVANVDAHTGNSKSDLAIKEVFNSGTVCERLFEQIDNSY